MTELIRVKDVATGHEYSIPGHLFNEEAHRLLDKPAADVRGVAIPTKYQTSIAEAVEAKRGPKAEKENV